MRPRLVVEAGVASLLARGTTPIVLGGDHSITYPVMRAFHRHLTGLTIVHFDAHGDLYDQFEGEPRGSTRLSGEHPPVCD